MEGYTDYFQYALDELSKLPGIGKKTAVRLLFHLLKKETQYTLDLTRALDRLRQTVRYCSKCHNLCHENLCKICVDKKRNPKVLCVVANITDIFVLENTQQYRGLYHVLGGLIAPIDGITPDELKIKDLIQRVQNEPIEELIFALSATMTGETTIHYIAEKLNFKKLKITRISKGIAIGHELEYTDETTLGRSLLERVPYH